MDKRLSRSSFTPSHTASKIDKLNKVLSRNLDLHSLSNSSSKNIASKFTARNPFESIGDSLHFLKNEWFEIAKNPQLAPNLTAGITVAAVALPLNVALSIAAELPPSTGLIAGGIGGLIAAIFGGSRFQATGPAAALNLMVFAIVAKFGPLGAAAAAIIIGLVQILLSALSAGNLIKYVPEVVLVGFTSGVGLKLLDSQLPKVFGIEWTVYEMLESLLHPIWLHEVTWNNFVCGMIVIFVILACRSFPRFPAALFGIAITSYLANFLNWPIHRVGEIPPLKLEWITPGFNSEIWLQILALSIPIGLLSAVESLLSAQAVDRLSGDKHHSNLEVLGQGLANIAAGFFGGMPVSGVVVRSTVAVQSGAKSRLASAIHAAALIFAVLYLGKTLALIPIASLAGLLCIIGFRLVEISELIHLIRSKPALAAAFLAATIGTLMNYIVSGMVAGIILYYLTELLEKKINENSTHQLPAEKSNIPISKSLPAHTGSHVYQLLEKGERWIQHLKAQSIIPNSSYVHPNSSIIGHVVLGKNVHIAAETSIRADEGTPFYLGDNTNVQDGVVLHALKKKWVNVQQQQWAIYVGKNVSLAHQALVHGPCFIGDNSFVGFKAVVHDSIVGSGSFIGIGSVVVGVELPVDSYVPHGAIIDSSEKVRQLAKVQSQHRHFNDDVVEVNVGLVGAYKEYDAIEINKDLEKIYG